jgi:hypothetical protein
LGAQENINVADLQADGWTICWSATYANAVTLSIILGGCNKAKLMLACRPTGSGTLTLAAAAYREDVLYDAGTGNVPHNASGTAWYYNGNWSWGFAAEGDAISRTSCDTLTTGANSKRLCFHTVGGTIVGGYRCGATRGLDGSSAWEKVILHRD